MRIVLCFLFALIAAPALAGWERMAENDDVTYYIDPATARKDGDFRKVWKILDLKQKGKSGEMSRKTLIEYDCKEDRSRTLSYSLYSEPMSGGNLILSNDYYSRWAVLPGGTDDAVTRSVLCAQ
jgi:hypothetical protein